MTNPPERRGGTEESARLLEAMTEATRRLRRLYPLAHVECFERRSHTLRVTRRVASRVNEVCRGTDDGVAVRLRRSDEKATRFASATGCDGSAAHQAAACALDGETHPGAVSDRWADTESVSIDRDEGAPPPTADDLRRWLDAAVASFAADRCGGDSSEVEQAWVEVAATIESWAVDGSAVGSRSRIRGWASIRCASGQGQRWRRPLLSAARRWETIDPERWIRIDTARAIERGRSVDLDSRRGRTVVFRPEPAAVLVSALVRYLVARGARADMPVGGGFVVWDAPDLHDALFGGRFDDSGFPTRRKLLTDGQLLREPLDGPGHDRRPSFRDPPAPLPSQLVVEPAAVTPPDDAFHVHRLSIQPLTVDRWVLEVGGSVAAGGVPQALIAASPLRLIRSLAGGFGEVESSHRAVTTPSLVAEDLTITL